HLRFSVLGHSVVQRDFTQSVNLGSEHVENSTITEIFQYLPAFLLILLANISIFLMKISINEIFLIIWRNLASKV
ncbi:MAG: hypothetical protein ACE5HI_05725, partial [bacterium]